MAIQDLIDASTYYYIEKTMDEDFKKLVSDLIVRRGNDAIVEQLCFMQAHGSSVTLNYGEDTDYWECSWITSGKRFSGYPHRMGSAVVDCLKLLVKHDQPAIRLRDRFA